MQTFYSILTLLGILLFFGGAWMLRREARCDRSVRVLIFILLMWGTAYLTAFLLQITGNPVQMGVMSVKALVLGGMYVIVSMLYPIEAVRPGWLGIRNATKLVLPYLCVTALYFTVLAMKHEPVRRLTSAAEMLMNIDEFNVWYRFVFYLTVSVYIAYMLLCTSRTELDYRKYRSDVSRKAVSATALRRIHYYGIGMGCITVVYLIVLLYGSPTSMLFHRITVIAVFAYTVFKILREVRSVKTTP